jgi:predicted deacylase
MVDGTVTLPEEQFCINKGNWLRPSVGGVFWPAVKPLQRVVEGQLLATVTDLFGHEKERLLAPKDGIMVGIRTAGTTASGEYAGNVGEIDSELSAG